jgi:hypothetical protein
MRTELAKGEGDNIKFGIRLPLTGSGVQGRDTVEGNEEKLIFKDFSVTIEELNHAVDTGGRMEEQRVPYNLLQEGKNGLNDWWAGKLSDYAFAVLCGDTGFEMVAGKGNFATAITAPDTEHWLRVNDVATDAAMTSADTIDLTFLDRLKQKAEVPTGKNCYKVRPWLWEARSITGLFFTTIALMLFVRILTLGSGVICCGLLTSCRFRMWRLSIMVC